MLGAAAIALDRAKLAKLLAKAGGSPFDGETLAFFRAADRMLRAARISWDEAVGANRSLPQRERGPPDDWRAEARVMAEAVLGAAGWALTPKQYDFLTAVRAGRIAALSPKQSKYLRDLHARFVGQAPP